MKKLLLILSIIPLIACSSLSQFNASVVDFIKNDLPGWQSALNGAWTLVGSVLTSDQFIAVLKSFGASDETAKDLTETIGTIDGKVTITNAVLNQVEALVAQVAK